MGTVELTGLEIIRTKALGAYLATPSMMSRTMPALILKRSSLVIPGLRGIPAGMTTMSAPVKAPLRPSSLGRNPLTGPAVEM
ncbi:hypothetical protein AWJ20_2902 [Sugiyamaella lignohabitans]|uniref:Uncharacterized protein n=1 Tax=Sugiyamaella lignohabitans TaxID=796027 RepID=A0A167FGP7_9ASCO|nr:uncharacterized protein AWJ20_2902 [Sugiyamaella lignohabitans]ANB15276.1 hypothetical protein AWJ20_2902 [Sugiyamaella lignohabitans]